ncbi:hypothetical protein L228DRAFT_147491 [Xylona heveae TC161]|uniref:BZIP domain-containing protein n=1 Tax=Xylona heveae (strain CBS 132557 / TC161) TaxID=1328760 RepID=A0A165GGI9_XYLHT|nr:hypothetical protein L228DRAFT_147491 [Xylona heveae TC161]KZF22159.1 hypothetical protein L228DRAFT_147491 [Xylona heveae TC161]
MEDRISPETAPLTKEESLREDYSTSITSTPEPDQELFAQDNAAQVQKRKGGRKPIYATSEERKQRNRQAQAAFRERRTEYIKQLETTIKRHEEALQTLRQSHRNAADECLMLRYKNSLLERILLEKGIDVQAELRAQTGSPHLGHPRPPSATQPPPIQRAIMNRHHQVHRSMPRMDPANPYPPPHADGLMPSHSPQLQPTPSSHNSSPVTNASVDTTPREGVTPPGSDLATSQQQQQQQHPQLPPHKGVKRSYSALQAYPPSSGPSQMGPATGRPGSGLPGAVGGPSSNYYPSPFQNHIDQLEQEYDAQADMVDEQDEGESRSSLGPGPGPFPHHYAHAPPPHQQQMPPGMHPQARPQSHPSAQPHPVSQSEAAGPVFGAVNQLFDPFDPSLDADPFGLSASMHFPSQFSFETSSMR